MAVFLQGCPRYCEGCHNPELLPMEGGHELSEIEFTEFLLKHISPLHQGITFSGGDPLAQADALQQVIALIRQKAPQLDIWVYTGFLYENIKNLPVVELIDVLVDGPFVEKQKDLQLVFRGSANQRIIDLQKSLNLGRVIQLNLDVISKAG
jgi:anaerobic ribonucleoside-triphosphate reductase activating protein